MAYFSYTAADPRGQPVQGTLEALDSKDLMHRLRSQGLYLQQSQEIAAPPPEPVFVLHPPWGPSLASFLKVILLHSWDILLGIKESSFSNRRFHPSARLKLSSRRLYRDLTQTPQAYVVIGVCVLLMIYLNYKPHTVASATIKDSSQVISCPDSVANELQKVRSGMSREQVEKMLTRQAADQPDPAKTYYLSEESYQISVRYKPAVQGGEPSPLDTVAGPPDVVRKP